MERVNIRVFGDVQGVFYRSTAVSIARGVGLMGWVKNTPDGSVEMVAEGEKEFLDQLIEWCREGSEFARVENVEVDWQKATGEFGSFEVRY